MVKIYNCFPGGKHKALTMSYDDGKVEDRRLVGIFNKHGIKGTFNINSGIEGDPTRIPFEELKELYAGHEVAIHTFNHPTISRCPSELVVSEVMEDRKRLEAIFGYPIHGMSYPNGSYDSRIVNMLPGLGIKYSRVVETTGGFEIPENFLTWHGTCHHNENLLEKGNRFVEFHKTQYLYLMYVWGHSFEFRTHDNWEVIEEFCEMAGNRDDIWYATNIQIVDYVEAMKRLEYSADLSMVYNPSAMSVWISVDGEVLEIKGGELKKIAKQG